VAFIELGSLNGYLLKWSGSAWVQRAAAVITLSDLAVLKGKLYAVSGTTTVLLEMELTPSEIVGALKLYLLIKLVVFMKRIFFIFF
jgi:hypothetical protein